MDLKIRDVAELLNVSETTIRRWLAEGKIPAYKLNHQYRFSKIEIENWVMSCKTGEEREGRVELSDEPEQENVGTHKFSLFRAIHKGLVLRDIDGDTKEEVIQNAMKLIAKELKADAEVVTELLLDRERLMPTSLNHGIAVPHTRDFHFKESYDVVAVVSPKKPIEYGALDGEKVHTLFFLFACGDKRHLHLLAKLAHMASDAKNLEYFKTKPLKPDLLKYVKSWESNIKELANH